MKVTVVLLLLLALLVLLGTIYQVDNGVYRAQQEFFYAWMVTALVVPLPGAQLLLWLLGVNLLVSLISHIARRRISFGLAVSHAGLVLLLVAGFQGLYYGDSYTLGLWEGQESSRVTVPGSWRLSYRLFDENGDLRSRDSLLERRSPMPI